MQQLLSKDTGMLCSITIVFITYSAMLYTLCYRPAESKEEGGMTTGANPAYGMSGPHRKQAEIEEEYEIPQQTSGAEGVYEGV